MPPLVLLAQGDKEQVATDEKLCQSQLEKGQAMQGDGVAEVMLRSIDPRDLARHQAQIAEAKTIEQPVEKKQDLVQRQEQSKQRQKKRAKKRDRGMEL